VLGARLVAKPAACIEEQNEGEPKNEHEQRGRSKPPTEAWSRTARQSTCLRTGLHERLRRRLCLSKTSKCLSGRELYCCH